MNVFFSHCIEHDIALLDEEEARHCFQVLRKKLGDTIALVDGKGGFYEGEIAEIGKKQGKIRITLSKKNYDQRPFHLHLAVAPTKNTDRLEWFLEKATEIGIDEITPILCEHSERKVLKTERLHSILRAAMKQSLRATLPTLHELTPFKAFIPTVSSHCKLLCHLNEASQPLAKLYTPSNNVTVLIGPEGDFSPSEITLALQHGFCASTLGTHRLRTETAALLACCQINFLNDL